MCVDVGAQSATGTTSSSQKAPFCTISFGAVIAFVVCVQRRVLALAPEPLPLQNFTFVAQSEANFSADVMLNAPELPCEQPDTPGLPEDLAEAVLEYLSEITVLQFRASTLNKTKCFDALGSNSSFISDDYCYKVTRLSRRPPSPF